MWGIIRAYLPVLGLAMVPVAELRAAIPAGIALDLPPLAVYVVSVIGNMLPVPFIVLFIRRILTWMQSREGILSRTANFCVDKANRSAALFYKYELLGLFILVAIPLPGTGAWTGALVAAMLNLRMKYSVPTIFLGVCVAGIAVLLLSCGAEAIFR